MPGFVSLTNKATGQTEVVDTAAVPAALASGKYASPDAVAVHENGLDTYVAPSVAQQERAFTPTIDPALAAKAGGHRIREDANTGLAAAGRAGLGGLASGLSAGLVSPFEDEQEFNPGVAFAGQAIGAIAPALVGDEAGLAGLAARFTPSGLIARAGTGVAERLGEGLLAKGAAGAAEGSLFGAAQGAGEVARSDDPLSWEYAASTIGSNALFGGALGGGLGLAGGAVERGLKASREAIESRLGTVARDSAIADTAPDLLTLDAKGLKAARDQELEALRAAQQPEREEFVRQLSDHLNETEGDELWKYTKKESDREARKLGKTSLKADFKVRDVLDNEQALMRNPAKALDGLERQEQTLQEVKELAERNLNKWSIEVEQAPQTIRKDILDGKVKGMVVGPGGLSPTSPLIDQEVERIMTTKYGAQVTQDRLANGGRIAGADIKITNSPHFEAAMDAGKALDRVRALKDSVAKLTAEPVSARLSAIDAAKEALGAPHVPTLGERLLHHIPGGGLVSEIAGLGGRATSGIRKAAGAAAQRTGEAVAAFLGKAEAGAAVVAPAAAPLATKVLQGIRYGAETAAPPAGMAPLPAAFRARTDEIKQLTAYDQTGIPRIRPQARQDIADRLHPVRVADPTLADRLETLAVRRLEYLSSLIPRQPDLGGLQTGPDRWHPSDMEMRSFARSAAAVEDPGGVEERVAAGTVTPEDAAAYWAVYPERAQHFQQQVLVRLPTLQKTLPYRKRLSLGIFTGLPVDPSMNPKVLAMLQGQFADEPSSEGGTAAPKANPQFGSIKKSVDQPTPAQHRAQGAA